MMIRPFLLALPLLLSSCSSWNLQDFYPKAASSQQEGPKILWSKSFDPSSKQDTGNLAISANIPTLFGEYLFMGDQSGGMMSFTAENGRIVWKSEEERLFNGQASIYQDQVLYGTDEGRFYSRNLYTGELKYAVDLGYPIDTQASFFEGRGCVHMRNHSITCFDAETGKVLWNYKRNISAVTTLQRMSRPLVTKGKVFVGHADGYITALNLEDGSLLWEQKLSNAAKFSDVHNSPVMHQGFLYVSALGGNLKRLDPQTGAVVQSYDVNPSRNPLFNSKGFVVATIDGKLIAMDTRGSVLKEVNFKDPLPVVGPVEWKGHIVVGVGHKIIFLDPQSLEFKKELALGHAYSFILGDFETSQDYLSFYTSRNRLYLLR